MPKHTHEQRYHSGAHCRYSLKVHLVFAVKYRRKLLYGDIRTDMYHYLTEVVSNAGCTLLAVDGEEDHVHMLIDYPQNISVSEIVKRIKQESTYRIWVHHPELRRDFWKHHTFWNDGYFACSVGQVSQARILEYINKQQCG